MALAFPTVVPDVSFIVTITSLIITCMFVAVYIVLITLHELYIVWL